MACILTHSCYFLGAWRALLALGIPAGAPAAGVFLALGCLAFSSSSAGQDEQQVQDPTPDDEARDGSANGMGVESLIGTIQTTSISTPPTWIRVIPLGHPTDGGMTHVKVEWLAGGAFQRTEGSSQHSGPSQVEPGHPTAGEPSQIGSGSAHRPGMTRVKVGWLASGASQRTGGSSQRGGPSHVEPGHPTAGPSRVGVGHPTYLG